MAFSAFFENYIQPHLDFKTSKRNITVAWRQEGAKGPLANSYPKFDDQIADTVLEIPMGLNDFPFPDMMWVVGTSISKNIKDQGFGEELLNYALTVAKQHSYRGIANNLEDMDDEEKKIWGNIPHEVIKGYAVLTQNFDL